MKGIKQVTISNNEYPELLRNIPNPPPTLYYRGNFDLIHQKSIAIVGARKASPYGKWAAYGLAKKLAQYQVAVVSGMAWGIDSSAHRGALENKGKTIAVLGCGVDICYPSSNQSLMDEIAEHGLILSEYEPGTKPLPYRFPMRNRIISGIALGTVVVEAGLNSGSLITAECAAEQGRNIYALPGNINNICSFGTNKLIKDGAIPLVVFDDIIDELGLQKNQLVGNTNEKLGRDEKMIYEYLLRYGESTTDELCSKTGKMPAEMNALITILEMKGVVQTAIGKIFIAN